MDQKNLKDIRNKIDKIDDKFVELFKERMNLSKEVAQYKKENNLPINNPLREKEIINNVSKNFYDENQKLYAINFFNNLFSISKAYQSTIFIEKSKIREKIISAIKNQEMEKLPVSAIVACQGIPGSYSNIATEKMFKASEILYFKNFESIFNAVDKGLCQFGVLPIENSSAGSVRRVYDDICKYDTCIVKSLILPIEHSICMNRGSGIENIKEIVSHEQAILQCSEFISSLKDVKIKYVENTAVAAKLVKDTNRKDIACIASTLAANIYNLEEVRTNAQNNKNNFTRFIIITKGFKVLNNANKISIRLRLAHTAGSLNKVISEFSIRGFNLTKLRSTPVQNSAFEFDFYFDFEGDIKNNETLDLISVIENISKDFKILGCYEEK